MKSNKPKGNTFSSSLSRIADKIDNIDSKKEFNLKHIELELLVPSEKNDYELVDIEKLAESIKSIGLQQNLIVRPMDDGKYEILGGHRRYEALKLNGVSKAPCKVATLDDIEAEIVLIETNEQVRDRDQMATARHIKRLSELYNARKKIDPKMKGKTRDLVGAKVGMSGMQVDRYNSLNDLIPEFQEMLSLNEITMSKVVMFAKLSHGEQKEAYELMKEYGKNVSREETQKLALDIKKAEGDKLELENVLNKFKEEKESLEGTVSNLKDANQKLETNNTELEKKLKEQNDNLDKVIKDTKEKLREEIEKDIKGKNQEEIKKLQEKLESLADEKSTVEKQLESVEETLKNEEEKENKDLANIEMNAELKFAIKEVEKSFSNLNVVSARFKGKIGLNEDNQNKIFELSGKFKSALDLLLGIRKI